jgi:hypothetical protein
LTIAMQARARRAPVPGTRAIPPRATRTSSADGRRSCAREVGAPGPGCLRDRWW